jgi:hypothetical protein
MVSVRTREKALHLLFFFDFHYGGFFGVKRDYISAEPVIFGILGKSSSYILALLLPQSSTGLPHHT